VTEPEAATETADERPVSEWTRAEKIAWCKERAAAKPWDQRVASMIQDMDQAGIPLSQAAVQLGEGEAMAYGEGGVQTWIDFIE
jgi:hypothetical protein